MWPSQNILIAFVGFSGAVAAIVSGILVQMLPFQEILGNQSLDESKLTFPDWAGVLMWSSIVALVSSGIGLGYGMGVLVNYDDAQADNWVTGTELRVLMLTSSLVSTAGFLLVSGALIYGAFRLSEGTL